MAIETIWEKGTSGRRKSSLNILSNMTGNSKEMPKADGVWGRGDGGKEEEGIILEDTGNVDGNKS